jgi:molecular chaperone GrpE
MNKTQAEENKTEDPGTSATPEPLVPVEPATVTAEQLDELKQRAGKADEHWERLVRTTADFDNFRKRATREKQEAIRFANESLMEKLLPVLDSFEMALSAANQSGPAGLESLQAGINLVQQQLRTVLTDAGLEEVDATGKMFDPNLHEAVSQQETTDAPEGQVVRQLRKGYRLKDRLLRPATVIVAKQPAA